MTYAPDQNALYVADTQNIKVSEAVHFGRFKYVEATELNEAFGSHSLQQARMHAHSCTQAWRTHPNTHLHMSFLNAIARADQEAGPDDAGGHGCSRRVSALFIYLQCACAWISGLMHFVPAAAEPCQKSLLTLPPINPCMQW